MAALAAVQPEPAAAAAAAAGLIAPASGAVPPEAELGAHVAARLEYEVVGRGRVALLHAVPPCEHAAGHSKHGRSACVE